MGCACAILSSVACPALQYFSTLSHKRQAFRKKVTEHKMFVVVFSTDLLETFPFLRRTERDMVKSVYWSSRKVQAFLSYFSETLIFSIYFRKTIKCLILFKSFYWKPRFSMRTDGQTDRKDEANSHSLQFDETV